ncbi:MarR family winged helix-turn-helix transcriptional regulator [Actinoplanes sp. CA-252034]|uniref:MarR family winged helix-turn-helix transcriptional regulator n=1 Tax=Actinoplanes sp. CA-252034 TaxID=3239906 RepID=UPI003D995249
MGRNSRNSDLARFDQALLRLRRMWDAPTGIAHEGRVVEGSTLLVCLAIAEAPGEIGVSEVTRALAVAPSTASRLVARATQAGMVSRAVSARDPRRVSLTLTSAGTRLVQASRVFRQARLQQMLASWPDDDVAMLADLLTRFAESAAEPMVGNSHHPRPPAGR